MQFVVEAVRDLRPPWFLPLVDQRSPPQVVVGHVQVFQREQEVVEGLARDLDKLVVVDDQVLQVDQPRQVPGAQRGQPVT